jgi:hypothetical protein
MNGTIKVVEGAHALPDVEVFYGCPDDIGIDAEQGWYYWYCFPGCLPDSDPVGPFATEAEALADAQGDAS